MNMTNGDQALSKEEEKNNLKIKQINKNYGCTEWYKMVT